MRVSVRGGSRLVQDLLSSVLDAHDVDVAVEDGADVDRPADILVQVVDRPLPAPGEYTNPTLLLVSPAELEFVGAPSHESGWSMVAMDLSPAELRAAIELTAGGSMVVSPRAKPFVAASRRSPLADLTPRELEVLRSLANGDATKTIGRELNLSVKTVEVHKANLFKKLGVRSASEAVSVALTSGLLADPSPDG